MAAVIPDLNNDLANLSRTFALNAARATQKVQEYYARTDTTAGIANHGTPLNAEERAMLDDAKEEQSYWSQLRDAAAQGFFLKLPTPRGMVDPNATCEGYYDAFTAAVAAQRVIYAPVPPSPSPDLGPVIGGTQIEQSPSRVTG